jgi:hypothetical protein
MEDDVHGRFWGENLAEIDHEGDLDRKTILKLS